MKHQLKYVLLILISLLTLSGCGVKMAYHYADWIIKWQLDDYVELTSDQQQTFDTHLTEVLDWHQREQLPIYHNRLQLLRDHVANQAWPLATDVVLKAPELWFNVSAYIAPRAVTLLNMLTEAQKRDLIAALKARQNEQQEEWLEREEQGEQARTKRVVERFERWTGRLDNNQKQMINDWLSQAPPNRTLHFENRQSWLNQFEESLSNSPVNEEQIVCLFTQNECMYSERYLALTAERTTLFAETLTTLLGTMSVKQQKQLLSEIDDYLGDIEELIAEKRRN